MDLIGKTIDGRFVIRRHLGSGGMGTVFVAHQLGPQRDVALKLLMPADASTEAMERFRREARALSRVNHEHIVVVHDSGTCATTGVHYLAMELLHGETLRARMRRPMDGVSAASLIAQILRGLQAIHRAGLVHRDVKPENIVLVDGRAKLVDFGIARSVEPGASMTATGSFIGTPGYAAPERALGDRSDDPAVDLYAVGVIWFELLARRPLFDGPTALAIALRHASEQPPRVRSCAVVEVHDEVDALIEGLLAKDPGQRPTLEQALACAERAAAATARDARRSAAIPGMRDDAHARLRTPDPSLASSAPTETATVVRSLASLLPPGPALGNAWLTASFDERARLLEVQRTSASLDADDVAQAWAWLDGWCASVDAASIGAVFDLRGGRAQLSPVFAEAMRTSLLARLGRFRASAVIVRSPTVRLQIERILRELALEQTSVFHDVEDARLFVLGR